MTQQCVDADARMERDVLWIYNETTSIVFMIRNQVQLAGIGRDSVFRARFFLRGVVVVDTVSR